MTAAARAAAKAVRRAFIVDDDVQMRALVAKVLVADGYAINEFVHAADVESALTQHKPELIVLDLTLGESDAVEILRSLAAARFNGSILLISGHGTDLLDEVQRIGSRHGLTMLPFLHKPFRLAELKARLDDVTLPTVVQAGGDLDAALRNDWLELWYQPKVDLKSMLVCGAEALARVRHPQLGVLEPARFLPPAGDPLYKPLTTFIVRRALADWPTFADKGLVVRPAINVPASILQDDDFVANVRRHLPAQAKFPGLIVEVTEDEAIADPEVAREVAVQLRLYNIHVAIDDFGAGHSSLERLSELPFTELKLDRQYVVGCASDARKRAICQAVVDFAHRSNITAVAEGVDDVADLKTLMAMGYDIAQGYLFARPMPRDAFVQLLISRAVRPREFAGMP